MVLHSGPAGLCVLCIACSSRSFIIGAYDEMEPMVLKVETLTGAGHQRNEDAEEVFARAYAGDADAFRLIFSRYSKPILSFVYSLLGNRVLAEELTQETFVRAYRRLYSKRPDTQLSTWLFGIARNVVREAVKKKYMSARGIDLDEPLAVAVRDTRTGPDEQIIAGELNRAIQRALAALHEDHRIAFVLKVLHKMSYAEISGVTGSSVGKLKTDLYRARSEMRARLTSYLGRKSSGERGGA